MSSIPRTALGFGLTPKRRGFGIFGRAWGGGTVSETYGLLRGALSDDERYISVIKTSQLMLYREIIAVCSQIHTKHINTVCGQNVELLNVKLVVHIVTTGL